MLALTIALYVSLAFLMIDAAIELAFVSTTVAFLNGRASSAWRIYSSNVTYGSTIYISGKPRVLLENPGHLSNASAGTALILVGFGGILALFLRSRRNFRNSLISKIIYHAWLLLSMLSVLLTLSALIYVFATQGMTYGYSISLSYASSLSNFRTQSATAYNEGIWTIEHWFAHLLADARLYYDSDRSNIYSHLQIIRGWTFGTIPLFILGLVVATLALTEALVGRKHARQNIANEKLADEHSDHAVAPAGAQNTRIAYK